MKAEVSARELPDWTCRRGTRPVICTGHKGAATVVRGNTLESLRAAARLGVDQIEFDVIRTSNERDAPIVLAHDPCDIGPHSPSLPTALTLLASSEFDDLRFNVDLKSCGSGFERRIISELREHGLENRCLISTMEVDSLPQLRLETDLARVALSVPKVTSNWMANPLVRPIAVGAIMVLRRRIPRLIARALRVGGIDACMAHHAIVTEYFVEEVLRADGELYVWTVDDDSQIARFAAMGVTGVTSNDPRLFEIFDTDSVKNPVGTTM